MTVDPTRGWGVLEHFLSQKRAEKATFLTNSFLSGGKALDVGCGRDSIFLRECRASFKVALDKHFSKKNVVRLSKVDIRTVVCDLEEEKIPFKNNTFEVVVMLALFEHLDPKNVERINSEVFRVLTKRGVLVLTTPAFWTAWLLRLMAILRLVSSIEIAEHKKSWRIGEIFDLLVKAGFDKKKIVGGYFQLGLNTWVVARK